VAGLATGHSPNTASSRSRAGVPGSGRRTARSPSVVGTVRRSVTVAEQRGHPFVRREAQDGVLASQFPGARRLVGTWKSHGEEERLAQRAHCTDSERATGVRQPHYQAAEKTDVMSDYVVKPLTPDTWDAFARLAERHNGVFGGCWCTWFQTFPAEKTCDADDNRALKQRLVDEGRAHAALVFEDDEAVVPKEGSDSGCPSWCSRLDLTGRRRGRGRLPARQRGPEGLRALRGTRNVFEHAGFTYVRPKGTRNCVMRIEVP
jgi:hypothetical protein